MNLVQEMSGRLREFNHHYLREVLQAERMALVGRFVSSIVHDLNILAIISFAAYMACLDTATAEARKTAQARISRQEQYVIVSRCEWLYASSRFIIDNCR